MTRCLIGQQRFDFAARGRVASSLDTLVSLIDWNTVAVPLDPLYPAVKGEPLGRRHSLEPLARTRR